MERCLIGLDRFARHRSRRLEAFNFSPAVEFQSRFQKLIQRVPVLDAPKYLKSSNLHHNFSLRGPKLRAHKKLSEYVAQNLTLNRSKVQGWGVM